jgi:hypothetical protein
MQKMAQPLNLKKVYAQRSSEFYYQNTDYQLKQNGICCCCRCRTKRANIQGSEISMVWWLHPFRKKDNQKRSTLLISNKVMEITGIAGWPDDGADITNEMKISSK